MRKYGQINGKAEKYPMMNISLTAHKAMNAGVAVTAVNGQAISNNNIINLT